MIYRCNFTQLSLGFIQLDAMLCGCEYPRVWVCACSHAPELIRPNAQREACVCLYVCVGHLEVNCDMSTGTFTKLMTVFL